MERITRQYGTIGRTVFVIAIAAGLLALIGGAGTAAAQTEVIEQESGDAVEEEAADVVEEEGVNNVTEQETTEVDEDTVEEPDDAELPESGAPESPPMPDLDLSGWFEA
ncbi:hypothetical protein [Natronorubrum halophilum]|uniref:hypothetical protein n=1 Tax=Natronorubrum halophilum TaxID=1702106 RepID=UPI0014850823|nr:hypothetical protein [Natronorubrum halophilum]